MHRRCGFLSSRFWGLKKAEKGQVALKNMKSGEQQEATRDLAVEIFERTLSRKDAKMQRKILRSNFLAAFASCVR